ncbi:MAG: hypothetical protein R3324_11360, partial [Halobacteriales archaeon]|nr:hypothetical protein [Halobacteriales archaeon]
MLYEQETLEQGKEGSAEVTYSVATTETADGTRLTFSDARDISLTGHSEDAKDVGLPTLKTVPTVVVRDGAVVGVPNAEAVREAIHASLDQMFGGLPGLAEGMKSQVTNEFVVEATKEDWASRGTAYHGKILQPGDEFREPTRVRLELLQVEVGGSYVMSLKERLPCPGTTNRTCVRLHRTLDLVPEVLQNAFDEARGSAVDSGSSERSSTTETADGTRLTFSDARDISLTGHSE